MTTFILIPGAGDDAWAWHRVVPLLERAGHTAIPVTLPAGDDAGLAEYGSTVAAAAEGHDDLVYVAHSMGAYAATVAAETLPPRLIVFVAAMIPKPGETGGEWWDGSGHTAAWRQLALEGHHLDASDEEATFYHDVPADVVAEQRARGDAPQSWRPFGDAFEATRWQSVPAVAVAGRNDRMFPLPFMRELVRDRLGIEPVEVESGHLPALAAPEALAEVLIEAASRPAA